MTPTDSEPLIRTLRSADLDPAIAAIRDGGWGERRPELTFYAQHAETVVFVAELDGDIVGTAIATFSEGVGWVGLVFVAPALRGRQLGTRLTQTALDNLRQRGSRAILLAASALGRPIYEKLGFVVDGEYAIMLGPGLASRPPATSALRAIQPRDVPRLTAFDRIATGEDRGHLLDALHAHGWLLERDGAPCGYALRTPWGLGPAIADDANTGRLLLDILRAERNPQDELRLLVPTENLPAIQHLTAAGFHQSALLPRMRLGEPIAWQPRRIWAAYSFSFG